MGTNRRTSTMKELASGRTCDLMESVDVSISKGHSIQPEFAPGFKKLLRKGRNDKPLRQQHKMAFKLVGEYCNYMASAKLGSRFTEMRVVNTTTLNSLKQQNNSFNAGGEVEILFVTVGGGYEKQSSHSTVHEAIKNNSKTMRMTTGAKPDMQTRTFPKAQMPGVLEAKFRPICDLIPDEDRTLRPLKECYRMFSVAGLLCSSPTTSHSFPSHHGRCRSCDGRFTEAKKVSKLHQPEKPWLTMMQRACFTSPMQ